MTDQQRPRRSRRAVRPAGTVGGDEDNLRSSIPVAPAEAWPGRPVAGSGGSNDPAARPRAVRRAPDDEDVGWGAPASDSNDERLTRDRPPHW